MTREPTPECRAILERISAYVDGDLDPPDCHAIERHCRRCPRCSEVVEGLRRTIGLCRRAGARPLPALVRRRARARMRALLAGAPLPPSRRTR